MTGPFAGRETLIAACELAGLNAAGAHLIRAHSNSVWLLPSESAVVRIGHNEHKGLRSRASLTLVRWLAAHQVPVTEPLLDEAIDIGTTTVTFWHYYPQESRGEPPMKALGTILAQLHALPAPPVDLPDYPPLEGFTATLANPEFQRALTHDDLDWLNARAHDLLDRYRRFDSRLGYGLIHADAYVGNCLWDGDRVILGDWDEACWGPRELDLNNSCHDLRFGSSEDDLAEFFAAYGLSLADYRGWDGAEVLFQMRDLHTLTGYIRRAAHGDLLADDQLQYRIRSLRHPSTPALWHSL
ncbi:phosphotransferase enzyme family protein (plasmid) [Nocardia sp. CA-084685]|uniref:phosphotransferase enzyme family protein n=1 Tax=Nocardia sp. CA-084685 TaxID=3239970 RepID=UPI003D971DA0